MRTSTWSWLMARRTPYETERPRLGNGSHNDALDAVRALRALLPPARLDGHAALPAPVLRLRPARAAARWAAAAARAAAARPGLKRRGRDSTPRTRLTPVTRFPVAPVQPLRPLAERTRSGHLAGPARQHGDLGPVGGHAGDLDVVAADHEVDVDLAVVRALRRGSL